jgi:hypothetical protein
MTKRLIFIVISLFFALPSLSFATDDSNNLKIIDTPNTKITLKYEDDLGNLQYATTIRFIDYV